jgi:hypothetical protein
MAEKGIGATAVALWNSPGIRAAVALRVCSEKTGRASGIAGAVFGRVSVDVKRVSNKGSISMFGGAVTQNNVDTARVVVYASFARQCTGVSIPVCLGDDISMFAGARVQSWWRVQTMSPNFSTFGSPEFQKEAMISMQIKPIPVLAVFWRARCGVSGARLCRSLGAASEADVGDVE